jgi:hypothetical protein
VFDLVLPSDEEGQNQLEVEQEDDEEDSAAPPAGDKGKGVDPRNRGGRGGGRR